MALSRTAWVGAGLGLRLLMIAVLAISVQLKFANNHTDYDYQADGFNIDLQSYTYAVAAAITGMASSLLQIPVAVYLLCKSRQMTPSVLILDVSMYADIVITVLLASSAGAGFGATDVALKYINSGDEIDDMKRDLRHYYHKATVPIVLLFIGMVLSLCATIVSARLRTRASTDDLADV
ncbi:hypothetical protein ACP70R_027259 [Stipagrostis hirtigluma subsp. patula]